MLEPLQRGYRDGYSDGYKQGRRVGKWGMFLACLCAWLFYWFILKGQCQ